MARVDVLFRGRASIVSVSVVSIGLVVREVLEMVLEVLEVR